MVLFQFSPDGSTNNYLYMMGGQSTGGGSMSNNIYRSSNGLFCDQGGVPCSRKGYCQEENLGCMCKPETAPTASPELYSGEYCQD